MKENSAAKHCAHDTLHCKFLVTSKSSPNTTIEFDRPPVALDSIKVLIAFLLVLGGLGVVASSGAVVASSGAENLSASFISGTRRTPMHAKLPVERWCAMDAGSGVERVTCSHMPTSFAHVVHTTTMVTHICVFLSSIIICAFCSPLLFYPFFPLFFSFSSTHPICFVSTVIL